MRLINADALLEVLKGEEEYLGGEGLESRADGIRDAIMDVISAPAIESGQQWIPCSEHLPKKDGRYQVTRHDDVTNTEFIDILWYEENLWWNRHSTGDYAVTAWMPLPEPYKGEQS